MILRDENKGRRAGRARGGRADFVVVSCAVKSLKVSKAWPDKPLSGSASRLACAEFAGANEKRLAVFAGKGTDTADYKLFSEVKEAKKLASG